MKNDYKSAQFLLQIESPTLCYFNRRPNFISRTAITYNYNLLIYGAPTLL